MPKRKKVGIVTRISAGPWPCQLFITRSLEAGVQFMVNHGAPESLINKDREGRNFSAVTIGWEGGCGVMILIIFPERNEQLEPFGISDIANTAAHEATHALQILNESIGEQYPGDEAEAYFVGYLTQGIVEMVLSEELQKIELR